MTKLKLATQLNIIFSFVTILGGMFFLFIVNLSFTKAYENQNKIYLDSYYNEILRLYEENPMGFSYESLTKYNDFFIIVDDQVVHYSKNNVTLQEFNQISNLMLREHFKGQETYTNRTLRYTIDGNIAYMGRIKRPLNGTKYGVFVVSNVTEFVEDMTGNIPFYTTLAFLNILVLGNIIIWLWSTSTVGKLKDLQSSVKQMIEDDYQSEVKVDSSAEEIASLAETINNMRIEIKNNEDTKKEMIQNLGHDLKTPIAVIRSYAEAIQDGIEGVKSTDLIIKQSDLLNKKVKQIIEYSKIGYIDNHNTYEKTSFKTIVEQVVNNYKYITNLRFIIDIETDWIHLMDPEGAHIAISNIVDNAVRYAQTKIVIQITEKKLTIFNDGEHIEENVLPKIFKAYEKGSKGQFGLGLAIVKETMDRFGLKVSVINHANGVLFTIELQ